jgi:hypothetical protein
MSNQASKDLSIFKTKLHKGLRVSEDIQLDPVASRTASENRLNKPGIQRLICGGLIFIGLTIGIFWYQFSEIPIDQRPPIWSQLQWGLRFGVSCNGAICSGC